MHVDAEKKVETLVERSFAKSLKKTAPRKGVNEVWN
jgi:hypothetical protein